MKYKIFSIMMIVCMYGSLCGMEERRSLQETLNVYFEVSRSMHVLDLLKNYQKTSIAEYDVLINLATAELAALNTSQLECREIINLKVATTDFIAYLREEKDTQIKNQNESVLEIAIQLLDNL